MSLRLDALLLSLLLRLRVKRVEIDRLQYELGEAALLDDRGNAFPGSACSPGQR